MNAKKLGTMNPNSGQRRIVYDKDYICPTLQAAMGEGGGNIPLIIEVDDDRDNWEQYTDKTSNE